MSAPKRKRLMQSSNVELPSNRKFGFSMTAAGWLAAIFCYHNNQIGWAYVIGTTGTSLFIATLVSAEALLPLNKLWMRFGFLLGSICSPIVMGIIYFGIVTPTAMLIRLLGRDELRLKMHGNRSHWVYRNPPENGGSFTNQF